MSREDLRKLSVAERLELVETIWETLEQDGAVEPPSEELKRELDRRWAEHLRDPSAAKTWDETREDLDRRS